MHIRARAAVSFVALTAVSVVTKLWSTSLSDHETAIVRMLEAAEASRLKAEREQSTKHVAYALGLCAAARMLVSDSEIERVTGVHVQTYEERLNASLCQYAKTRRKKRQQASES